jgi:hypothetical protein
MLVDKVNYMRIRVFQDRITMEEDFRQGLTKDLLFVSIAILGKCFVQWLEPAVGGSRISKFDESTFRGIHFEL